MCGSDGGFVNMRMHCKHVRILLRPSKVRHFRNVNAGGGGEDDEFGADG